MSNIPNWSVQAGFHHLGKVSNLVLNLLVCNFTLNSMKLRMKSLFSRTMSAPKMAEQMAGDLLAVYITDINHHHDFLRL